MESSALQFTTKLSENQIIIRDTVRDFAEKNIRPHIMEFDESQEFPVEIIHQLGELGFLGILVSEEYGGAGLGYEDFSIIIEELAKVDPSVSLSEKIFDCSDFWSKNWSMGINRILIRQ
jgi:alkylation response protein AidB-like acyl-CoA dehydrogenase